MKEHVISIVIIDDHPVISHGLRGIFSKEEQLLVAGEAKDATEALDVVSNTKPDIIILDISLGGSDGIDLIESLLDVSPSTRIIMYTMHYNKDLVVWSFQAGAKGYMLKSDKTADLVQAVIEVFQGQTHLSASIPSTVLADVTTGHRNP